MTDLNDLKDSIKKWYDLDKRIEEMNLQLSTMRDKKKDLENTVILQMKQQGLQDKKLNIGPVSIIYSSTMQLPPYNLELIEEVLDKLYKKGSPQSIHFLQTLHANREGNRKPNCCIKKRKNRSTKKKTRHISQTDTCPRSNPNPNPNPNPRPTHSTTQNQNSLYQNPV